MAYYISHTKVSAFLRHDNHQQVSFLYKPVLIPQFPLHVHQLAVTQHGVELPHAELQKKISRRLGRGLRPRSLPRASSNSLFNPAKKTNTRPAQDFSCSENNRSCFPIHQFQTNQFLPNNQQLIVIRHHVSISFLLSPHSSIQIICLRAVFQIGVRFLNRLLDITGSR